MAAQDEMQKIKELREATGFSFGEIKKALTEAGGNAAKALEALKLFGTAQALKKAARQVKSGTVEAYVHSTRKIGSLIVVLCETDFVAKSEEFQALARDLAMQVVAMKPATVQELLEQSFIRDPAVTVKDLVENAVGKLGENIQIDRFSLFEV